jgi:hypothetical protein
MRLATCTLVLALLASLAAAGAGARGSDRSVIDGRWSWNYPLAQARRFCRGCANNSSVAGPSMSEFRDGRIYALDPSTGRVIAFRGTYSVAGDVVSFVFTHKYPGLMTGKTYVMRFSLYRDRLTWSLLPGRAGLSDLTIGPWTRVGS